MRSARRTKYCRRDTTLPPSASIRNGSARRNPLSTKKRLTPVCPACTNASAGDTSMPRVSIFGTTMPLAWKRTTRLIATPRSDSISGK